MPSEDNKTFVGLEPLDNIPNNMCSFMLYCKTIFVTSIFLGLHLTRTIVRIRVQTWIVCKTYLVLGYIK